MGRNKIAPEHKKDRLTISISKKNNDNFEKFEVKNKSKLVEWLLNEHFEAINSKG